MRSAEVYPRGSVQELQQLHPIVTDAVAEQLHKHSDLVEAQARHKVTSEKLVAEWRAECDAARASAIRGVAVALPPEPTIQPILWGAEFQRVNDAIEQRLWRQRREIQSELAASFSAAVGALRGRLRALLAGEVVTELAEPFDLEALSSVVDSWAFLDRMSDGLISPTPRHWVTEAELLGAALGSTRLSDIVASTAAPKVDQSLAEMAVYPDERTDNDQPKGITRLIPLSDSEAAELQSAIASVFKSEPTAVEPQADG